MLTCSDIDQNPKYLDELQLCQGIANLSPNGPDDGGLVVIRGSHKLHHQFFDTKGGINGAADRGEEFEGYDYTMDDVQWYNKHGCEQVKICANAGDLIRKSPAGSAIIDPKVFDSRTIHWNASPVGKQTRFVQYVAYTPRSLMSEEDIRIKHQIFKDRKGTTGWAVCSLPMSCFPS